MKRFLLFAGCPYNDSKSRWGAFYSDFNSRKEAERVGQEVASRERDGGAYHVVDAKARRIVANSR